MLKQDHTPAETPNQQLYFDYLDDLRTSGKVNMFGAIPHLQKAFPELSRPEANAHFIAWMKAFGKEPAKEHFQECQTCGALAKLHKGLCPACNEKN